MTETIKAPFPYFGGKSQVAEQVWRCFGKVNNYIEPFCGSLATLLCRPIVGGYETVNDKSHFIANFWRAVKADPEGVARFCEHPVCEIDMHARHSWLMFSEFSEVFHEKMRVDPDYYDIKIAGWWCWGQCHWIGAGWCSETGLTKEGRMALKQPKVKRTIFLVKQQMVSIGGSRGIHRSESVIDWILSLSDRLKEVRICSGDWIRVCNSKSTTTHLGMTAIFFDPPYLKSTGRDMRLYAEESGTIADDVRERCLEWGSNKKIRIALCGYEGEHNNLEEHGWRKWAWKANGGYSNRSSDNKNSSKERIWFSPYCLEDKQPELVF